jgi:selenide,water dikinase
MRALNRTAASALASLPADAVHACTDITGFGLAGHASEMAAASRVTLRFEAANVPMFKGVAEIALQNRSGGLGTNQDFFAAGVDIVPGVPLPILSLLFDPQTSGGLLIAAEPSTAAKVAGALEAAGGAAFRVGDVMDAVGETRVRVV